MADDTDDTAPPAHDPAVKGKGKGGKLLNGPHREMIIVICSVVGVGLALLTFRGKGSTATSSTAGATAALGSGQSAVLSGGQVAGFDQNAVYGLQTMLANQSNLLQGLEASLTTAAPTPTSTTTPITTNSAWINEAMQGWIDNGGQALDMQAALTQYTQGQAINTAQESGVNWAIHQYGTAPQGTTGVSPVVRA